MSYGLVYGFYPRGCVLSILEPWREDRKHSTSWIKSYPTPNYITYLNYVLQLFFYIKLSYRLIKSNNALNVCKQYYELH